MLFERTDRVCTVTVLNKAQQGTLYEQAPGTVEIAAIILEGDKGHLSGDIPKTMKQALESEDAEYWKSAILEEIENH